MTGERWPGKRMKETVRTLDERAAVCRMLERGLDELAELRKRYGQHRDFDLVEHHQRRLLDQLESGRSVEPC